MLRSEKKFIDRVLRIGTRLPKEIVGFHPRVLIRSMRKRLRMTQHQLARRAGFPQSYIAKIESGNKRPTIETLEKIFRGFNCTLVFLLIPEVNPDEMLERQALIAAQKKVKYVAGTMALEEQLPSKKALQEMIEEEKKKLLDSETTKIWDEC